MSNLSVLPAKKTIQERLLESMTSGTALELTDQELTIAAADADLMIEVQTIWQNRLKIRVMTEGSEELFKILKDPKIKVKEKLEVFKTLAIVSHGTSSIHSPEGQRGRPRKAAGSANPYDEMLDAKIADTE